MTFFEKKFSVCAMYTIVVLGCGTGDVPVVESPDASPDAAGICRMAREVCDGADNNCNGEVDEGVTNSCGECGAPPSEVCNNLDDDCNGIADDGTNPCGGVCALLQAPGEPCEGADVDLCQDDTYVCDDLNRTVCSLGTDDEELCDGADNDCNGIADDGTNPCGGVCLLLHIPNEPCDVEDPADLDLCTEDEYACLDLNRTVCVNINNDLDRDHYSPGPIACSGDCNDGESRISPGSPELYGDDTDNDCDGAIDEEFRRNVGTITVSGSLSFEVCALQASARVIVADHLILTCETLLVEESASLRADAVGDVGLCNGGAGSGGGGSASGGGGGGGCYAAPAGNGGYGGWVAVALPGMGGTSVYGTASGPDVFAGSRGGDGGGIYCPPGVAPGVDSCGARGGGSIEIYVSEEATIQGTISVNGGSGDRRGWSICDDGAGGGGGGGTILIAASRIVVDSTARISARGGTGGRGGSGCGPSSYGGGGGGGSGGRIKIHTDEALLDGTAYVDTAAFVRDAASRGLLTVVHGDGGAAGGITAEPGQRGEDGTIAEIAP